MSFDSRLFSVLFAALAVFTAGITVGGVMFGDLEETQFPSGMDYEAGYRDGYHQGLHDSGGLLFTICDPDTVAMTFCMIVPIISLYVGMVVGIRIREIEGGVEDRAS